MATVNQTLVSLVALAGNADAALHAAFSDLTRGIAQLVKHGNKNPLADTRDALATLGKRASVTMVATMVQDAYAAADIEFSTHKRANPDADAAVARIVAACVTTFDASAAAAKAAKAAKAAENKAAKDKAAKDLQRAAKSVEPLAKALALVDAIAMIRAACSAGDDVALAAIESMAGEFFDVTESA